MVVVVAVLATACLDHGPSGLQKIAEEASEERSDDGFAVVVIDAEGDRTTGVAGTRSDGTPMNADDPWVIGSVSKAFVATTIMQMVDEGLISLDAHPVDHLAFEFIPPETTVFDLVHHSSGIPDYTTEEWAALMRSCPARAPHPYEYVATEPEFEPGTQWSYSNTNYLLLGDLIEAVTGRPVEVEMRTRILDPLELSDTYVLNRETGKPPMAASQDFYDTGPGPLSVCQMEPAPGPAPVDGFMVSSVTDLDTFYRALFGGDLVSAESLEAMMSQDYVGAEHGHGLGVIHLLEPPVDGIDIYANGGGVVGYKTLLMIELNTMTTVIAVSPNGFAFENQQDEVLRWAFGRQ